ncbi:MAG: alpha/beta fold hydrolase [Acidobacteriota bacterium]
MKNLYSFALRRASLAFAITLFAFVTASAQAQQTAQTKVATVYGAKIHYLEAGTGPAVILLHGLGGSSSNWASTIGPLSQKYRVIVPDQIGFGRSDKPFINYRVGTLVDFLNGLYRELKIERASLVGNSLGGFTAAAFALAYPQKVDRIVLVDAAGFAFPKEADPRLLNALNPSTREGIKQIMSMVFYNKAMFANDAAVDALYAQKIAAGDGYTVQRFIESIVRGEDVLDGKLGAIKHPTLIIWGREDELTPLAMGERFKKELPNAELFIIEKCGHVPQMEKASEFNTALIKFLGGSSN